MRRSSEPPSATERVVRLRALKIVALAAGAGLGSAVLLLLLRAAVSHTSLTVSWLAEEVGGQLATYAYLALSTAGVLSLGGVFAGRTIAELHASSLTDPLTQVANRRALEERLRMEIERAAVTGLAVSFMLVDVDELKTINDKDGHVAGDAALRRVAEVLVRACRSRDMVARWGGDEFAVVMSRTRAAEAEAVARRVHLALEGLEHDAKSAVPRLSVSIGIADHDAPWQIRPLALFGAADRALRRAKEQGRHRTNFASKPPPPAGPRSVPAPRESARSHAPPRHAGVKG